jgi:hypothetical protein
MNEWIFGYLYRLYYDTVKHRGGWGGGGGGGGWGAEDTWDSSNLRFLTTRKINKESSDGHTVFEQ